VLAAATAALRLGDTEWAAEALAAAGPVAREGGLFFMPWLSPSDLAGLVALCLDRGIVTDYAVEAVRRLGLRAPSQLPLHADWPWQVRVRLLGSNEILHAEESRSRPAPARRRVPDLLRALILLGPGEVEEHRLASALWPDKDADTARNALQAALYRLRKLLGTDALVRKDGRVAIDRSRCWIDLWALQEELRRGPGPDGDLTPGQPETVLELYQGPITTGTVLGPLELRVQADLRTRLLGVLVPHLKQLQREHQTSGAWRPLGWLAGDPALELEVGRALSSSIR